MLCHSLMTVSFLVNVPVHMRETVAHFTPERQSLFESRRHRRRLTGEVKWLSPYFSPFFCSDTRVCIQTFYGQRKGAVIVVVYLFQIVLKE